VAAIVAGLLSRRLVDPSTHLVAAGTRRFNRLSRHTTVTFCMVDRPAARVDLRPIAAWVVEGTDPGSAIELLIGPNVDTAHVAAAIAADPSGSCSSGVGPRVAAAVGSCSGNCSGCCNSTCSSALIRETVSSFYFINDFKSIIFKI